MVDRQSVFLLENTIRDFRDSVDKLVNAEALANKIHTELTNALDEHSEVVAAHTVAIERQNLLLAELLGHGDSVSFADRMIDIIARFAVSVEQFDAATKRK